MTAHVPPMWCRSFTSNDNVDHWGSVETWNIALANVKIAISTYQVLYDALVHRTPRQFYAQLLQFTNQLSIEPRVPLRSSLGNTNGSLILERLRELLQSPHEQNGNSKKSQRQLTRFGNKAETIGRELGSWAATNYIQTSITQFKEHMRLNAEITHTPSPEQEYTMEVLCKLGNIEHYGGLVHSDNISPMSECLLDTLIKEHRKGFRALIFVSQRATVLALKWLIENHPGTRKRLRCGTFVGMSRIHQSKTELGDVHDIRSQMETLQKFRDGLLDLIITTDALEEGIDIPACNTVLNFNCTLNLKSFIQRRGRARREHSKFIIILRDEEDLENVFHLESLERELVRKLQDDGRTVAPDNSKDDEQLRDQLVFRSSTGAQMTMGNSISHLYRFCSELPAQLFVNNNPVFSCEMDECGQAQAVVRLPSNLDASLQTFKSLRKWARKRWAKEDAALQAYKGLFHAGLINDHLLPLRVSDIIEKTIPPRSHYLIPGQLDPWYDVALLWSRRGELFRHELRIVRPQKEDIELFMILPVPLKMDMRIPLFLSSNMEYTAVVSSARAISTDISICQQVTRLILQSVHQGHGPQSNTDYVNIIVPNMDPVGMSDFFEAHSGRTSLAVCLQQRRNVPGSIGLLRHVTKACRPLCIEVIEGHENQGPHRDGATLPIRGKIHQLTRRRNFLNELKTVTSTPTDKLQSTSLVGQGLSELAAEDYLVDRLPSIYAEAALLAPSIIHQIGVYLIAERLRKEIFSNPQAARFERMDLLCIALSPTDDAHRPEFRSMAFIGDAIAKFLITRQLFLHHTLWHEGLLTSMKDSIVSDTGLTTAICHSGFGPYLITTRFNGKRWRPAFVSTTLSNPSRNSQRQVGAATVADMAKALAGAAYLDNGLDQAFICVAAMIPKIKSWTTMSLYDGTYSKSRPSKSLGATTIVDLEGLLGYTFSDTSLAIESMTHPSCVGLYGTTSYRRLSFLGASIIELVVVRYLHRQKSFINSKRLQSLKSAVTNNMFLTFICLTFYWEKEHDTIEVDSMGTPRVIRTRDRVLLYNFLRSQSKTLSAKVSSLEGTFTSHLHIVKGDLWERGIYPWAGLSAFRDLKVLSDIVQSVFGAIYIDSSASLQKCETLAERMGILPLLEHFISHNVVTDHPKRPAPTQMQNV
ncbi:hypothetical protein ANOM_000520 [Aspergillus nomiae NRRL 13137]|uniref:Dicer-like protein 1 n=1 Tax=Aspergillus nomiae NRRL (strain ATCC 15546 / NRRL 13137 / CBS 260.88 / M93) TaxID=1509407 RepID=A0A0L1JHF5_ASPN3|nr:uncharacterized protein ANOM_000520 [Aspergillus nomiae NRRL 13137]KNG91132.1 hypothetical protein ANOM_000520 [Aspergillus nomiae NRRL 13137]